jgi:tetratricopeptide (TPR) repeat protein
VVTLPGQPTWAAYLRNFSSGISTPGGHFLHGATRKNQLVTSGRPDKLRGRLNKVSPAASQTSVLSRPSKDLYFIAAILGLTMLVYWPALGGASLWDDAAHLTRAELRGWDGLARIWFEPGATQQYYPVLHTAFWFEHRLWGDATMPYHLVNVVLHVLNCCLLAIVSRRLLGASAGSRGASQREHALFPVEWLIAALFAVHPVCVESVAWISEQKNTLSTAFYLLSAWFFFGFVEVRKGRSYGMAVGFFLLAVGTKSVTCTLPAALLVVRWWKHGRIDWRRDGLPLLPWFGIAAAAGLLTAYVEKVYIGADLVVPSLSLLQRTLLASRALWFYLEKAVWPLGITFFYEHWDVAADAASWAGYLVGALALTAALAWYARRNRGPLAAWLLYAGTLFPALGFFKVFPFSFSYVADHFQYLALLFVVVAAGSAFSLARARGRWVTVSVVAGALVFALAFLSRRQSALYRDDETLFRANIAANPRSWMGHHILATHFARNPETRDQAIALYRKAIELHPKNPDSLAALAGLLVREPGHREEAMALFREAVRLRPSYAEAHNGLANELAALPGRLPEAIEHYETALRLRPDFALAEANLAQALARVPERRAEALGHFERALRALPNYAPARYNFAHLLASLPERQNDAIREFEAVLREWPQSPEAHFGLAKSLVRSGRAAEAIPHFEAALEQQPDSPELHAAFGDALAQMPHRLPDALSQFEAALRLNPRLGWVHYAMAVQLMRVPARADEARRHLEEAMRLDPRDVDALNVLGVLFAQQGRMNDARDAWSRALSIKPDFEPARNNLRRLEQGSNRR